MNVVNIPASCQGELENQQHLIQVALGSCMQLCFSYIVTSVLSGSFHMLLCLSHSMFPIRPTEGLFIHLSKKGTCGFIPAGSVSMSVNKCLQISLFDKLSHFLTKRDSCEATHPHTVTEANDSLQNFSICFITFNPVCSSTLTQLGCKSFLSAGQILCLFTSQHSSDQSL